jgi:hypothetical protein
MLNVAIVHNVRALMTNSAGIETCSLVLETYSFYNRCVPYVDEVYRERNSFSFYLDAKFFLKYSVKKNSPLYLLLHQMRIENSHCKHLSYADLQHFSFILLK